jgi:SH3-like domain-containing protein
MIRRSLFSTFFIILYIFSQDVFATQQIQEVDYFASLRSNETNIRSGPGSNYPIKFTFKLRNLPVRIVSEYDNWCEIEDYEGSRGWVAQNLITKKRHLMTFSKKSIIDIHAKKNEASKVIFHLENYVIGEYLKCEESWCSLKINDKKGWVLSSDLYGVGNIEI